MSDTSFCSNSACHGNVWTYAGFDAPALREALLGQLPTPAATPALVAGEATYDAGIGSLLQSRCGACHGPNGIQGLDVSSYATLMAGGASGPAIQRGNPDGSLLIVKLTGDQPHFAQFSADELDLLREWIAAGAPE